MAVYKRDYQTYKGPLTNVRLRFLVIPRYAFQDLFQWKILLLLFLVGYIAPLVGGVLIYLHHNAKALQVLQVPVAELLPIDVKFFGFFLWFQCFYAFFFATLVGPGLISPDLNNNALPLYLSRPLTRWDYVLGKISVLIILLSALTWLPVILMYAFQANMEGWRWLTSNWRTGVAVMLSAAVWILVVSLLALALSAWVRWRPVAGALLLGVFFVGAGFGAIVNQVLDTRWGHLLNVGGMMSTVADWLFGVQNRTIDFPVPGAFVGLGVVCALCLLLLSRKLKAYEVVRS